MIQPPQKRPIRPFPSMAPFSINLKSKRAKSTRPRTPTSPGSFYSPRSPVWPPAASPPRNRDENYHLPSTSDLGLGADAMLHHPLDSLPYTQASTSRVFFDGPTDLREVSEYGEMIRGYPGDNEKSAAIAVPRPSTAPLRRASAHRPPRMKSGSVSTLHDHTHQSSEGVEGTHYISGRRAPPPPIQVPSLRQLSDRAAASAMHSTHSRPEKAAVAEVRFEERKGLPAVPAGPIAKRSGVPTIDESPRVGSAISSTSAETTTQKVLKGNQSGKDNFANLHDPGNAIITPEDALTSFTRSHGGNHDPEAQDAEDIRSGSSLKQAPRLVALRSNSSPASTVARGHASGPVIEIHEPPSHPYANSPMKSALLPNRSPPRGPTTGESSWKSPFPRSPLSFVGSDNASHDTHTSPSNDGVHVSYVPQAGDLILSPAFILSADGHTPLFPPGYTMARKSEDITIGHPSIGSVLEMPPSGRALSMARQDSATLPLEYREDEHLDTPLPYHNNSHGPSSLSGHIQDSLSQPSPVASLSDIPPVESHDSINSSARDAGQQRQERSFNTGGRATPNSHGAAMDGVHRLRRTVSAALMSGSISRSDSGSSSKSSLGDKPLGSSRDRFLDSAKRFMTSSKVTSIPEAYSKQEIGQTSSEPEGSSRKGRSPDAALQGTSPSTLSSTHSPFSPPQGPSLRSNTYPSSGDNSTRSKPKNPPPSSFTRMPSNSSHTNRPRSASDTSPRLRATVSQESISSQKIIFPPSPVDSAINIPALTDGSLNEGIVAARVRAFTSPTLVAGSRSASTLGTHETARSDAGASILPTKLRRKRSHRKVSKSTTPDSSQPADVTASPVPKRNPTPIIPPAEGKIIQSRTIPQRPPREDEDPSPEIPTQTLTIPRAHVRPALPVGPRANSRQPYLSRSASHDEALNVKSTDSKFNTSAPLPTPSQLASRLHPVTIIPPMTSRSPSPRDERHGHTPTSPLFDTVPIRWKGFTLDHAKWTFTSEQLQALVGRAIKQSAEVTAIRLLNQFALDVEIPRELERLETQRDKIKAKYQHDARRRRLLLRSLDLYVDGSDIPTAQRLVKEITETSKNCESLSTELFAVMDQIAQLHRLRDNHNSSALTMALHKLNAAFLRSSTEVEELRVQLAAAEAEREDGWEKAFEMEMELERLRANLDSNSLVSEAEASRGVISSGRVLAARKTSTRASKASLRPSSSRRSARSSSHSMRFANLSFPLPPSFLPTPGPANDVPPVPNVSSDLPSPSGTKFRPESIVSRLTYASISTPSSTTRVMLQAQNEVLQMLGLSMVDLEHSPRFNARRPRSASLQSPTHLSIASRSRPTSLLSPHSPGARRHSFSDSLDARSSYGIPSVTISHDDPDNLLRTVLTHASPNESPNIL